MELSPEAQQAAPGWRGARNGNFAAAGYGSIPAVGVVASLDVGDVTDGDMTIALGGTMLDSWPAALASGAVDGLLGLVLIVLKTLVH